jgi:hypothetical protein
MQCADRLQCARKDIYSGNRMPLDWYAVLSSNFILSLSH